MTPDYLNISCNTNISTPIERNKHVLINFIINHDNSNEKKLNSSHRTRLAIMSEEELINKALSLGISHEQINQYTKPKLKTKNRDVLLEYTCEDGRACENPGETCGTDGLYRCGLYQNWNDLQKYYYNMPDPNQKSDFTHSREWEFVGCGIDLNSNDSTSSASICKDKYPGLCEAHKEKCNSQNPKEKEAIMLDCPETCNVQFTDLEKYKETQVGQLSICTSRGRCKWSHDMDPSNLLPPCEEHTSRETGDPVKCRNFNSLTDGPDAGSCSLKSHPETLNSPTCKEQRCSSMRGCVYTAPTERYCQRDEAPDPRIVREVDCSGRWIGESATGGTCIMPQRNYYEGDAGLVNIDTDCPLLGGTIKGGAQESCEYKPDLPYLGQDPVIIQLI